MNVKPENTENQKPEDSKPETATDEIKPEDASKVAGGAFDTYMQFTDYKG